MCWNLPGRLPLRNQRFLKIPLHSLFRSFSFVPTSLYLDYSIPIQLTLSLYSNSTYSLTAHPVSLRAQLYYFNNWLRRSPPANFIGIFSTWWELAWNSFSHSLFSIFLSLCLLISLHSIISLLRFSLTLIPSLLLLSSIFLDYIFEVNSSTSHLLSIFLSSFVSNFYFYSVWLFSISDQITEISPRLTVEEQHRGFQYCRSSIRQRSKARHNYV